MREIWSLAGDLRALLRDGWLERFYAALEAEHDWLETATPGDAVRSHAPLGRADLPAASYNEMMEWALPTQARLRFQAIEKEFASRADVKQFLRGGDLARFHGEVSGIEFAAEKNAARFGEDAATGVEPAAREQVSLKRGREAETHLLRSQCNDAYWHGVFGGVYSPHLRTAPWRALVEAEAIADGLAHREPVGRSRNGAISMRMGARKFALRRRIIRRSCARRMAGRFARWISGRRTWL